MTVGFLPALSLTERVPVDGAGSYPVSDRARWRLSRWRGSQAFATAGAWQRRLAADACDEDALLRLLDEPAARIAERLAHPPDWSRRLQRLYSGPAADDWRPERLPGRPLDDALIIAAPILADARRRVREAAADLAGPATPVDPRTADTLGIADLLDELVRLLSRASVLELNVARVRGELTGQTPAQRFAAFFAGMAQPSAASEFLAEYPVLARQLLAVVDAWASSTIEFLRRLHADWAAIAPALDVDPRVRLTGLTPAGDAHRGGRRVCLASFDDGSRVVYKPRDLGVDARFQLLLGWLNRRDPDLGLRTIAVLTRDGYGWTEFVAATEPTAVSRYARRYGSLLALLHTLGASDCHPRNVVGAGDTPVLVDLETLFTPALTHGSRDAAAGEAVAASVLAVGLLPAAEQPAGEAAACNCAEWLGAGTDEMQLHVPGVHIGHGTPAAPEGVRPADLRAHEADVVAGFRHAYDLLHRHAGVLADQVRAFAGDEIRVVLRPTRTYARLQEALLHTDHLRDALDRDRLLDWLWVGVEELPVLATTIAAERADLAAGDTPLFTSRVGSRGLWTGDAQQLPGALARSALDETLRRIAGLGEADQERQVWLIRATFASLAELPDAPHAEVRWRPGPMPVEPSTFRPLLAHAAEVGERIAAMAHGGTWFTFGPTVGARWAPVPMGAGLYDGLSGLALFYGYLGETTGHEDFTDLAAGIARRLGDRLRADGLPTTAVGAFNGWGGLCYAYGHLATLWDDDPGIRSGLDLALSRLEALADDADDADVVNGLAGAVLAVLACGADQQRTVDLARRLGDRLLTTGPALRLGGLSHGAAGVAAALFELWSVTGEDRYAEAGRSALEFDRSLFDPASGNWADLRRPGLLSNAWCHGAPGIGLSRVRIRQALTRRPLPLLDGLDAEIAVALGTTFTHGFGRNHSLCHGDLGNLDLPLLAGSDPAAVGAVVDGVLRDVAAHGWRCANPAGLDSPELMTGLAGIGYQLMRLAEPERVPSLLTLAGTP
ncbi:type 2 lanthipeptide synthetase LanM family protein [Micromonospora peucetia]|uniref:type 2 lanthipeptide synthetase LanM family protein n=1 Tax=Micromonospora peucetia TaxID=47871 RepID=UPI0022543143|nr:type 2 lanthipeptide synthetase LanM family protein [Micromonospora peucetia]MCX4385687.1 type 2 lanthipeptide synthetase LanM family protein [Micromonospora peucetia]